MVHHLLVNMALRPLSKMKPQNDERASTQERQTQQSIQLCMTLFHQQKIKFVTSFDLSIFFNEDLFYNFNKSISLPFA